MATASWTTLGTLGAGASALVDEAGRLTAPDGSWSFRWSIGAEDRWYLPEETANVRQTCLDGVPVVETRMRVPGGDVIHRCYALHVAGAGGGNEWAVVEVENDSAVPVGLAVSRPDPARLVLPRRPSDERDGGRELVFTLTHRATITFLVSLDGAASDPDMSLLPPLPAVVSGWKAQLDRGARLVLPDDRLQQAIDTSRAHLLVDASRSIGPAVATALDEFGLHGDARSVIARLVEFRFDARRGSFGDLASNTAVVTAVGRHQQLAPDVEFAAAVADRFAAGVQALLDAVRPRRFGLRRPVRAPGVIAALGVAVPFLESVSETEAAATVSAALAELGPNAPVAAEDSGREAWSAVEEMLASASPTWTWTNAAGDGRSSGASARFLHRVRRTVVAEHDEGLVVLPGIGGRWPGRPVEVHDLPTCHGALSFAVRWHGERPALLWELDRSDASVTLTCGLDDRWSSVDQVGEALLDAPSLPSVVGPDAGESFA